MIIAISKFFQEFSNRELAIFIWIVVAVVWCIFYPKIRKSLFQLIKDFFAWKLTVSYLLMFTYITAIIFILNTLGIWDISHLPLTILWSVCVAFVMLFDFAKANEPTFFKSAFKDNLKGLIFVEFLVNLYVFNIFAELFLVPVFAVLGGMIAIANADEQYEIVKKILNFILGIIGLSFLGYASYMAIKDFSNFVSLKNLESFYLPILLSILFIPFVYFAALYAGYETFFKRLRFFVPDVAVLRYSKFKTLFVFNINIWELNKWSEYINSEWRFKSKNEVNEAIVDFKNKAQRKKE